jgi:hypothetical protein
MSNGNWLIFVQRPIAQGLLAGGALLLGFAMLSLVLKRRDWRARLAEVEAGESSGGG